MAPAQRLPSVREESAPSDIYSSHPKPAAMREIRYLVVIIPHPLAPSTPSTPHGVETADGGMKPPRLERGNIYLGEDDGGSAAIVLPKPHRRGNETHR
jgi:hypothetical protein